LCLSFHLFVEHQTIAAKWRANTFIALGKRNDIEIRTKFIGEYVEQIMTNDLKVLFKGFFGEEVDVSLTEPQYEELKIIVSTAWDWNYVLKGGVVMLGDFQPTTCENGIPFDPRRMVDFEPNRKSKGSPGVAMCTIGLGLTLSRSKAKGSSPDDVVVCKASVVTEQVYE
jgi:hypothetical protein